MLGVEMQDGEKSAGVGGAIESPLAGTLELHQVREMTAREYRDFMRLVRKHYALSPAGKWNSAIGVVWWIVAFLFALSVAASFEHLRPVAPDLAWQLVITAIACYALLFSIGRMNDFIRARRIRRRAKGTIFLIEPDGFHTKSQFGEFKGFWRSIPIMIENDQYLFAMLTDTIGSIIVKSSFNGQDVTAFCAEAQQRWRAAQTVPA